MLHWLHERIEVPRAVVIVWLVSLASNVGYLLKLFFN